MPKYQSNDIAQLAHQLTLSPRRQRLSQIVGAQRLLELVDDDKEYPYDFLCFHLTGYRPLQPSKKPLLKSGTLISDLVRLTEHLSQSAGIPLATIAEPFQTQEQLSQRLNVSMKTIARWRQRGLSGLRVIDCDHVSRLIFTEESLQRFVRSNRAMILKGGAFRHLSEEERAAIVERAARLVASRRMKLQEVARVISQETGRAVETIRYTLRRRDQQCPDSALFEASGRPKIPDDYHSIYQAYQQGLGARQIARQFSRAQTTVTRICREMQAYELLNRKPSFVFHPEFDAPDAKQRILNIAEPAAEQNNGKKVRSPADAPAYLKALYELPLLTRDQEQDLFRRYNFCKYTAYSLLQQLEPCQARRKQIEKIEGYFQLADDYQKRIIQANLRLVVSIANRYRSRAGNVFELISDGNMALLRAVLRFDFSRGFKFSTYASWAIMKHFVRTIPQERHRYTRYVTGKDELLEAAPDRCTPAATQPSEMEGLRLALVLGMEKLDKREREILTCHYGLDNGCQPTTLEQLGNRYGVSKERVRQIEKRALSKLKQFLSPSLADYVNSA